MIFAKLDVDLSDHPRALAAGSAMATWAWALAYTRKHELDGFVPDAALALSWAGPKQAAKDAERLIAVGLWTRSEGGFRVGNYAEKNETKAKIAERRAEARERMQRIREQRRSRDVRANTERTSGERSRGVPGSGSDSVSDLSLSRSEESQQVTARAAPLGDIPPPWWSKAIATAEQTTGRTCDGPAARWLEYLAARERKGWSPSQRDATGWLAAVLGSDARRERDRGSSARLRGADITKQPVDDNAPWMREARGGTT